MAEVAAADATVGVAAGGAAAAQHLAERGRAREPVAEGSGHHHLHPALDQCEQRLQPFQHLRLRRCRLGLEHPLGQQLFHRARIG